MARHTLHKKKTFGHISYAIHWNILASQISIIIFFFFFNFRKEEGEDCEDDEKTTVSSLCLIYLANLLSGYGAAQMQHAWQKLCCFTIKRHRRLQVNICNNHKTVPAEEILVELFSSRLSYNISNRALNSAKV